MNVHNHGSVDTVQEQIGGLAASIQTSGTVNIESSSNTGAITLNVPSSYQGNFAGGFVGLYSAIGTVSKCFNTGNVTVSPASGLNNHSQAGFIGNFSTATINDSYNQGNISSDATAPTASGGFIGTYNSGTLARNYNAGQVWDVTGADSFVGSGSPTDTNNFAVNDVDPSPNGATGDSPANLKIQSTFTNWNFTDIWTTFGDLSFPVHR